VYLRALVQDLDVGAFDKFVQARQR
jgi:hypothetical protein